MEKAVQLSWECGMKKGGQSDKEKRWAREKPDVGGNAYKQREKRVEKRSKVGKRPRAPLSRLRERF